MEHLVELEAETGLSLLTALKAIFRKVSGSKSAQIQPCLLIRLSSPKPIKTTKVGYRRPHHCQAIVTSKPFRVLEGVC